MRRFAGLLAIGLLAASAAMVGARADQGTISLAHPSLTWFGGPVRGAAPDPSSCAGQSCDEFMLSIQVPSSAWKRPGDGVVVRVEWPDRNDELDMHIYDPKGAEVATSFDLRTNVEQALIHAPAPGTYRVLVLGFHAINVKYSGRAWIARSDYRSATFERSTMRFSSPSFVDPQVWAAEPSIWAARDGTTYVTAPWALGQGVSMVWRSRDAARTFRVLPSRIAPGIADPRMRPCELSAGGGDADIIADRTGRLYFVDLWVVNSTVGVSTDGGDTWTCNPLAASSPEDDRPWLAPAPTADGDGPNVDAYMTYRDFALGGVLPYAGAAVKAISGHIDVTRDGGVTWTKASTFANDRMGFAGPVFTASDGTVYQVYQFEGSVMLARSTDQGRTVRLLNVSERAGNPSNFWVAGDVDAAGNVYVAWVEQGSWDVLFTRSTDRGLHWSRPLRLNTPASESATMPWLAAGKAGDVAVSWYGYMGDSSSDGAPPSARWYPWVARTLNGSSSSARFQVGRLAESPVRLGQLCTLQLGCQDKRLGDFFEIDIAPDGALVAAFNDGARIHTKGDDPPAPYVMVTRQSSGLGMARSAGLAREPAGDATAPDQMTDQDVAQLDLAALPSYRAVPGGMRLGMRLSSTQDLTGALAASNGVATDAYWIVMWKANDRVEYAGLHVDRNGKQSFFGGDQPVGLKRPFDTSTGVQDKLAGYPATFALTGKVEAGQIFVDVPLSMFHLRKNDVMNSVQAFTMTSLLDRRTFLQPFLVVDSTPSQAFRIV